MQFPFPIILLALSAIARAAPSPSPALADSSAKYLLPRFTSTEPVEQLPSPRLHSRYSFAEPAERSQTRPILPRHDIPYLREIAYLRRRGLYLRRRNALLERRNALLERRRGGKMKFSEPKSKKDNKADGNPDAIKSGDSGAQKFIKVLGSLSSGIAMGGAKII